MRKEGDGKMIKGVLLDMESWSRRRGKDVLGEEGNRVKIGLKVEESDRSPGKRCLRPMGKSLLISESASSVSYPHLVLWSGTFGA